MRLLSFFKVVLDEALQDGRLEIEGYVAVKLKICLADKILLKVPNAEVWPIALSWDVDIGSLWLEKGWQEFANFYSLEHGCFLFFSYEGVGSCFKVRIFKENSLEADYPFKSEHYDRVHGEAFRRASQYQSDHPFSAVQLCPSYLNRPLKLHQPFVDRYISPFSRQPLSRRVNLQMPEGGTWSAKITVGQSGRTKYSRIHGGWTHFVKDNHLQAKDAIVLELIQQQPDVTIKVHIFRA